MGLVATIKAKLGSAWHVQGDAVVDALLPATDGTTEASKIVTVDANKAADAIMIGKSGGTAGFFGKTPLAQPSSASQTAITITATTALATATISQVGTSGKYAFANSTVAKAYVARMKQVQVDIEAVGVLLGKVRADLKSLGLIKGAA